LTFSLSGDRKTEILGRRNAIEKRVIHIVEQGQKDGSIRGGDSRLHVFFFMGALNWLNAWFDSEGRSSGDDIANHFALQLRDGISA